MLTVYLLYTYNRCISRLSKRRKVFSTYQCLFERYRSFQSFNETHFAQENIEDVNYGQIRTWIVSLVDGVQCFRNRKVASLKAFYRFLLKKQNNNTNFVEAYLKKLRYFRSIFEKEVAEVLIQSPVGFEEVRNK
jgi:integrase/recombinase XerC